MMNVLFLLCAMGFLAVLGVGATLLGVGAFLYCSRPEQPDIKDDRFDWFGGIF